MTEHAPPAEIAGLSPFRWAALRLFSWAVLGPYRLARRDRLSLGKGVVANHRLIMWGPGRIEIGDHANLFTVGMGRRTRIMARTPDATIRIGRNVRLNGAHLQADTLIDIGADCIIGDAHIIDTDIHSLALDRRTNPAARVETAPVVLERNVWVARGAAVLRGVRIGEGSVIGYGSVVTADVPARVLAAGNPARVVRSLE